MVNTEKNYTYFKDNLQKYLNINRNKYVLIKDCSDAGFFNTFEEALGFSISQNYELGTYLIQKCTDKPEDDAAVFYSRVGIANR
jgi:hypothetical protein